MRNVNVNNLIDNAQFNPFHWKLLFWCALIIIFDGYDLVIYGVVLPRLMDQWGLSPVEAGVLGSYALFGMMFGALLFGPLSDRFGRKRMIAICVVLFSGMTFINGFASTPTQFGICRFLAGIGIGGVMPNVVALMTEYAPKKLRSTMVAIMFSGYSIGGMMSAGLGIWLIPTFGWSSVFFIAGIPLLILPLIIRALPESPGFLLRQKRTAETGSILARIEPGFTPQSADQYQLETGAKNTSVPLVQLFQDRRTLSTLMFWTAFFMCLLMVYAIASWLPKLMVQAGYGFNSSLMFLLVLNIGAILGAIGGGFVADRLHLKRVLIVFFLFAVASISLLGYKHDIAVLYGLLMVAGATTIGSQILLYAYAAQFYPLAIRSTGIGWSSGIGRIGAIVGPMLGGSLLAMNLPLEQNFMAFAIPGIIAAVAVATISRSVEHAPEEEKNLAYAAETGMLKPD